MNWRAPYSPPLPARKLRKRKEMHVSVMAIRTRKLIGTIALLVLVVVWSLLGMTVAQTPWLANSGWLQAIFYVVAGLGWVLPAMPIVSGLGRRSMRALYLPVSCGTLPARCGRSTQPRCCKTASPASTLPVRSTASR